MPSEHLLEHHWLHDHITTAESWHARVETDVFIPNTKSRDHKP